MTEMAASALFRVSGVTTTRGSGEDHVHPLDEVEAVIAPGRTTAVVGPSGSGKSTLLRLLNRMEEPARGVVTFHDRPLPSYDVLELRRRVGLLLQRPTPFAGTVLDNLRAGRESLGESEAVALLDRVGLAPSFLGRVAVELSGGEAQRMCLARALAVGPEVLLLDEPTSALDPFAAAVVERTARSLVDDGMTVVFVSHDLRQARRIADDLLVVHGGRVVDPDDPVARGFLAGAS